MRVLVVDDEEAGRYLVTALLTGYGHEVVAAADGAEALRAAREQSVPFDIVISDILMPNMDGYALCREWKADPALRETPLVFYTASYTDSADERFAASLGADAFFVKPMEPAELMRSIEGVVEAHRTRAVAAGVPEPLGESEVLREYNERLVAKLEEKVVETNKANSDMTRALELLSDEVEVKKTLIEQLTLDMSARDRAEAELRATAEMLRTVIRSSALALIALDTRWRVRAWNPAAERLLGWTADELLGHPYPPYERDPEGVEAFYGPLMRGEVESVRGQFVRIGKDGEPRELDIRASALHDDSGAVSGVVATGEDVSESRRIEMVKSAFLSMVSHELRTPLTSIIGYSDLLEGMDVRERPEMVEQLVPKIRERAGRLRALIDDLLDASRIQSGPVRIEKEPGDIVALVRREAEAAGIGPEHTIAVEAEPNLPLVPMDRDRVGKVIAHLIANAVKYSPSGGPVTIRVRGEAGHVLVSVSDKGVGIAPSDAEHVFDRFTQGDMTDSRSFGGIGVGLFLARQTVEQHNGTLSVESSPGDGSTFTISLPVA